MMLYTEYILCVLSTRITPPSICASESCYGRGPRSVSGPAYWTYIKSLAHSHECSLDEAVSEQKMMIWRPSRRQTSQTVINVTALFHNVKISQTSFSKKSPPLPYHDSSVVCWRLVGRRHRNCDLEYDVARPVRPASLLCSSLTGVRGGRRPGATGGSRRFSRA